MFSQVWKKYLPVIIILLKRSATGEQVLDMNHTDFTRAAGGRKVKFSFNALLIDKGRISIMVKQTPFAKEFATVLLEDEVTRKMLKQMHLEFSMNNSSQLTIRNLATAEATEATEEIPAEETAMSAETGVA
jgi:hypothetical protein